MSSGKASDSGEPFKREYPDRPIASVAVCVLKSGKILAAKRANPPSQGLWSVPGGATELGETIQETAHREIDEECGIKIEVGQVFMVENLIVPDGRGSIRFHYVVTYILAHYVSGEARPDSDALEVRWVTPEEMNNLDMNPVVRRNMLKAFEIGHPSI